MAVNFSVDSSTSVQTLVEQGQASSATILNTDTNALYVLIGTGSASSTKYTVALNQGDYFETPPFYREEAITGIWAANGSGAALVTEF